MLPIDPTSRAKLSADNLDMRLVDTADRTVFDAWGQAATRGFHGGEQSAEKLDWLHEGIADRRTTGIWDGENPRPVGTVDGFESPLTVPGGADVSAWAISMVTVAQTHRRRGIAREMLESELRAAVAQGIPMAMLTVSESTIYGRFGFAPAALAADYTIDTKRARWVGPRPEGRVEYVSLEDARAQIDELYVTARLASPGEMRVWPRRWDQIIGTDAAEPDLGKRPRAARYVDVDGVTQGFVIYSLKETPHDFTGHVADVQYLTSNTADAYAALWRFMLELDLTKEVTALLRSVDEPLRWMLNDFRAVKVETYDHLWLRILDVPAVLNAREFYAPLDLVIEVTDSLDHAAGTYRLAPVVEPVETPPALTLSVNALSAIYLGGVSATTLHRAGQITEHAPGAVAQLDAAFRSPVTPWLSVWF